MEGRGYDISGSGLIKCGSKLIGRVGKLSVHIYPETIFLNIEKAPVTPSLLKTFLDPTLPDLEVIVEAGQYYYVVKDGKVNRATLSAKRGENLYVKQVEIVSLHIEMVPR